MLVKPPVPVLAENHKPNDKIVWDYHMTELLKTERISTEICVTYLLY